MYNGDDRVKQVNAIEELANDAVSNAQVSIEDYNGDWQALVTDMSAFTLEGIDLPDWWDEHDTYLLENRILAGFGYEGES